MVESPCFAAGSAKDLHLTVRVYDYAQLPAEERHELAANAQRILRQAGVEVEFVECYRAGVETGLPACSGCLHPAEFMLRIFTAKSTANGKQPAFAAMTPEGGAIMTLYINPMECGGGGGALGYGTRLGHAVAHEIGHLLLGPNSHSSGGIMRSVWRKTEDESMAKRSLLFDSGQASRLRATLIARSSR